MIKNKLSGIIIESAIKIHRKLGPGLLESAYQTCLKYELEKKGLKVVKEKPMPVIYEEVKPDHGYRIDLLVEDKVIVELKAVDIVTDVHKAQVLTYLRLGEYKLGLLINFKVKMLKDGIKRIVNNL